MPKNKNGLFMAAFGVVLLVAAGIGFYNFFAGSSSDLGGSLIFVDGQVEVYDGGEWKTAEQGTDVEKGMQFRTQNGKAVIAFDEGSAVRLDAYTEVELATLSSDHIVIDTKEGRVYNRVDSASELTWDVIAQETTTTAMGTAFTVESDAGDDLVEVEVFESQVNVGVGMEEEALDETVDAGSGMQIDLSQDLNDATSYYAVTLEDAAADAFLVWNMQEDVAASYDCGVFNAVGQNTFTVEEGDEESDEEEEEDDEEASEEDEDFVGISLKVSSTDNGAYLSWYVAGVDVDHGFKVVKGSSVNPVYPGNAAVYLSDHGTRAYTWKLDPGTYNFRVCTYDGDGACDVYSNNVAITVADEEKEDETPSDGGYIGLSGEATDSGVYFTWALSDGLTAPKGFKLVKSTSANPVYPGNDYQYLSSPDTRAYTWGLTDGKTYHFRVCVYTGSGCSVYSNDITVTAPSKEVHEREWIFGSMPSLSANDVAGEGVKLSWGKATVDGFKYYKVVRSETNSSPYYPNDGYISVISDINTLSYKDTGAVVGKTYYYRICAVDGIDDVYCGNVVQVTHN